ncbi:hypothetical protein Tco_0377523 [Tanacetum coccineum]
MELLREKEQDPLLVDARNMLTDSFLPTHFWAEAVSVRTGYVLNRFRKHAKHEGHKKLTKMQVSEEIIDVGFMLRMMTLLKTVLYCKYGLLIFKQPSSQQQQLVKRRLREEEQVFMDDLERIKKQEKEAYGGS